ncbi:MAG: SH3-like domain-containing protein [Calditrichaeota bacterium]|nr:SH3-like domain-containing protein [Calditrichota bacterium]
MRYLSFILIVFMVLISSCEKNDAQQSDTQTGQMESLSGHKVSVVEVQQASQYTYLKVKENDEEYWMAVTKMNASEGETYYYGGRMEMNNFKSKDLDRTFDKVYFVQQISKQPLVTQNTPGSGMGMGAAAGGRPSVAKEDVNIEPVAGGKTIADLFAKKEDLKGKNIKVRGKVTKVNNGIMGKNWIHIQDGTSSADKYDLTITTNEMFKVGEVVTLEGIVATDKDFGAGYAYDLLLEEGKRINPAKM